MVLGNYNRLLEEECEGEACREKVHIRIEDVIVHKQYSKFSKEHDIALLKILEPITFDGLNFLLRSVCFHVLFERMLSI